MSTEGNSVKIYQPYVSDNVFSRIIFVWRVIGKILILVSSGKHLRMKATQDLHLTYSKNGGNQG